MSRYRIFKVVSKRRVRLRDLEQLVEMYQRLYSLAAIDVIVEHEDLFCAAWWQFRSRKVRVVIWSPITLSHDIRTTWMSLHSAYLFLQGALAAIIVQERLK